MRGLRPPPPPPPPPLPSLQVGNIAPVAIGAALSADVPLRDALLVSVPACYAAASLGFVAVGFSLRTAAEAKTEKAE